MRKIVTLFSVLFVFVSCNAQEDKDNKLSQNNDPELAEAKPKESWKVDKEFDEDGNLIRLDSTYTWSFSSDGKEVSPETIDSLMDNFRLRLNSDYPSMFNDDLFGFFTRDSIGTNSFFQEDFFMKNWQNRMEEMEEMIQKSDSIHKEYLDEFRKKQI